MERQYVHMCTGITCVFRLSSLSGSPLHISLPDNSTVEELYSKVAKQLQLVSSTRPEGKPTRLFLF